MLVKTVWLMVFMALLDQSCFGDTINPLLRGQQAPAPVLIIAHRGARAYAPENTLESFEKAIRLGAHMFELDVQLTRDGHLIVIHDNDLLRCSNVRQKFPGRRSYYVPHFSLAEIQQLDAGSWFVAQLKQPAAKRQEFLRSLTEREQKMYISAQDLEHYASGQVRHPTLQQVLQLVRRHHCLVNIEIKNLPRFYPKIAEKTVELVTSMHLTQSVLISSFDHYQVKRCKELNPKIATAFLCTNYLYQPGRYGRDMLQADAFHPVFYQLGLFSDQFEKTGHLPLELIRSVHQAGLAINTWTVNDPQQMRLLIKAGVNGIITDYPNRLVDVLQHQ